MLRSIVRVLSGVLLALVPWAAATAQAGSIRGTVSDSAGNPLGSASVSVEGTGLTASTAASGEYEVRGVSPGTLHGAGAPGGVRPRRAGGDGGAG